MSYSWQISKSNWLIRFLLTGYFLAFIACFFNALALPIKLILAISLLFHAWQTLQKLVNESWQLDFDNENGWQIFEFSTTKSIEILPSTVVSRFFVFLHFRHLNQNFYRLILKDALISNINDYRQLRVILKTYQ